MNNAKAVAAGVAAGYLLGRTKKMKLALLVGAVAMGRKVDLTALAQQVPGLQNLPSDLRGRMVETGRAAATTAARRGLDRVSDNLEDRVERLRGDTEPADDEAAEDEPEDEASEDEAQEEEAAEEKPAKKRSSTRGGSGGGSAKKKTAKKTASSGSGNRRRRSNA